MRSPSSPHMPLAPRLVALLFGAMLVLGTGCALLAPPVLLEDDEERDQGAPSQEEMGPRDADPDLPLVLDMPRDLDPSPDLDEGTRDTPDLIDIADDLDSDTLDASPDLEDLAPSTGEWHRADDSRPLHILFLGDELISPGPIPTLVQQLATAAAWPTPTVVHVSQTALTLADHRLRSDSLREIARGDWDVVVLQDDTERLTMSAGTPLRFEEDATSLYDLVRTQNPEARVLLFEPWAHAPDHAIYISTFSDTAQMQAEISATLLDARDQYIPTNATQATAPQNPDIAPIGSAWSHYLARPDALTLHEADGLLPNLYGQWLSALVLYGTIYERRVTHLPLPLEAGWYRTQQLIESADAALDTSLAAGGPDGVPFPDARPPELDRGDQVRCDFGKSARSPAPWQNIGHESMNDIPITDAQGDALRLLLDVASFQGLQDGGAATNTLGYPLSASKDTIWFGPVNAATTKAFGKVVFKGLDPQHTYSLTLFASRTEDDMGNGRVTRYEIDGQMQSLDVVDNTDRQVIFTGLHADAYGLLELVVRVDPTTTSRYGYLGVAILERTD